MQKQEIFERARTLPASRKTLCRLYLYASASCLDAQSLEELRLLLQSRLGLSETEWMRAAENCSAKWTAKSLRQSSRLASSRAVSDFEKHSAGHLRSKNGKGISLSQARGLLCRLYVLSFHSLSARLGQNCLKRSWLDLLCSLLNDPQGLKPVLADIERPIAQAVSGKLSPTSSRFVFSVMVSSELVSDALFFAHTGNSAGQLSVIRETLRASRKWNEDELARFLRPEGLPADLEGIFVPADHPLQGLEPVINPSETLLLSEEIPVPSLPADPEENHYSASEHSTTSE